MVRPDPKSIKLTIKKAVYNLRSDHEQPSSEEEDDPITSAQPRNMASDDNCDTETIPETDHPRPTASSSAPADALANALIRLNQRLDQMDEERKAERKARQATDRALRDLLSPSRNSSCRRARHDEREYVDNRRAASAHPVRSPRPSERAATRPRERKEAPAPRRHRSSSSDASPARQRTSRRDRSTTPELPRRRSAHPRDAGRHDHHRRSPSAARRDASPESLVRAILATTRKGLRHKKGVHPDYVYPHELIERGSDKKPIKRGEASYEEYAVALRFMENQSAFHPDDLPALRAHSLQVAEDARELPWFIVREWSEEIFDRIADGRLPQGWRDPVALSNARFAQIQISSIQRRPRQDPAPGRGTTAPSAPVYDKDDKNSGKPCGPWNRAESSCEKTTRGRYHMEEGLKLVHICAYCAYKLGRTLAHSELVCANKRRNVDKKGDNERKGFQ